MLADLLNNLTSEQKQELAELGIPSSRRSEWKNGHRKPTAAQLMVLAMITKTDPQPLLAWLAEQEATPAQLDFFRAHAANRALKMAAGATALLTATIVKANCLYPSAIPADQHQPNMLHIVDRLRQLLRRAGRQLTPGLNVTMARSAGFFFAWPRPIDSAC